MGSSMLIAVLPVPTDPNTLPDWAAARAAVDQLEYQQLGEWVLNRIEDEVDDAQVDNEPVVLAAVKARLHERVTELEEAFATGRDLTTLYLLDRRFLVSGGPSWGDSPTESFEALVELADTIPVAEALAGEHQPVPPTASTPALDVGQVVEVDGFGRYTLTDEATLAPAPDGPEVHARAEMGSVIYLRGLHHADGIHPQLGPGYFVIEQDYRDLEDETSYPVLTALVQND